MCYTPPGEGEAFGAIDDLGLPHANGIHATGVSNNGDVAGHFVSTVDGLWHAFLWIDGDPGRLSGPGHAGWRRTPDSVGLEVPKIRDRSSSRLKMGAVFAAERCSKPGLRCNRYDGFGTFVRLHPTLQDFPTSFDCAYSIVGGACRGQKVLSSDAQSGDDPAEPEVMAE